MIAPRSRLLFWVAVIVLPFSVLAAVYPSAVLISLVLIAVLVLVAVLDGVLAVGILDGISVKAPEIMRFSKDRDGTIELRVRNEKQTGRNLRLGLSLPREIHSPHDEVHVTLPAASEWSRLDWPCRPGQRGRFQLQRSYLEAASPLGFWSVRGAAPLASELRVYPNLLTERKNLAALFLNRGTFGLHAQRQVGKGRDFEKLREYIPGDSVDEIHWKATAKRGHPVTKVFQIERTQEVYVIIDASRLSARVVGQPSVGSGQSSVGGGPLAAGQLAVGNGPLAVGGGQLAVGGGSLVGEQESGPPVLERFITAALVLGLAAEQQGDLFGLLTFTDKVETFVRAKNGKAHYNTCRDALYTLQPQVVTPDFEELATFIRLRLRRRALLVFLTSLDDPVLAEGLVRHIDLLSRQHLVLINMLKPAGANPLFSSAAVTGLDDLYRHLGGHIQWHNLRELEKVLQRRGVRFSLLENEKLSADLVTQYLGVKQRQLI